MHDQYNGADDRLAAGVQHASADAGGGDVLRKNWRCNQQADNGER